MLIGVGFAVLLYAIGLWGFFAVALLSNIGRSVRLGPMDWKEPPPSVSIVLPARNEAHQVEACVRSLLAQDYPDLELIAVDDRSEDGTCELLERLASADARMTVVRGAELPDGWVGKCWAVHQGIARSSGAWLFFTDADTVFEPGALSAAMGAARGRSLDMLTAVPHLQCISFWEKVALPAILLTALGANPIFNLENPRWPHSLAFGPFILVARAAYDRAGGHEGVRFDIVEDVALAEKVKASGGAIGFGSAVAYARVRMYRNFGEIWHGWTKNFFGGLRGNWKLAIVGMLTWVVAGVGPWGAVLALGWLVMHGAPLWPDGVLLGMASVGVALQALEAGSVCRRFCRLSPAWCLAGPLAFLGMAAVMGASTFNCLFGTGPRWKGRTYAQMYRRPSPRGT